MTFIAIKMKLLAPGIRADIFLVETFEESALYLISSVQYRAESLTNYIPRRRYMHTYNITLVRISRPRPLQDNMTIMIMIEGPPVGASECDNFITDFPARFPRPDCFF